MSKIQASESNSLTIMRKAQGTRGKGQGIQVTAIYKKLKRLRSYTWQSICEGVQNTHAIHCVHD